MEKLLSKEQVVDNIHFLCEKKNIKLGTLEKECGVSPGYLSRIYSSKNNESYPNIEFLFKASKYLNVSIDFLLTLNYKYDTLPTEGEELIFRFVEKLIKETNKKIVIWENIYHERILSKNDEHYIDLKDDKELSALTDFFDQYEIDKNNLNNIYRLYFKKNDVLFLLNNGTKCFLIYLGKMNKTEHAYMTMDLSYSGNDKIEAKLYALFSELFDVVKLKTSRFKTNKRFIKFITDYVDGENGTI